MLESVSPQRSNVRFVGSCLTLWCLLGGGEEITRREIVGSATVAKLASPRAAELSIRSTAKNLCCFEIACDFGVHTNHLG